MHCRDSAKKKYGTKMIEPIKKPVATGLVTATDINDFNSIEPKSQGLQVTIGYGKYATPKNPEEIFTMESGELAITKNIQLRSIEEVLVMVDDPQCVSKDDAKWAIFSNLVNRSHLEQEKNGCFCALWFDLDDHPPSLEVVQAVVLETFGDVNLVLYNSRSATSENQRCRGIIPLDKAITGREFVICQRFLNRVFVNAGITPDISTDRAGQVCYLPNRGSFYRSISHLERDYFDPLGFFGDQIKQAIEDEGSSVTATPPSQKAIENAKALLDVIKAAGLYKKPLGNGVHDITCPWVDSHTDGKDSGTAFFDPNAQNNHVGGFSCLHAHCEGKRIHHLLAYLEKKFNTRNLLSGGEKDDFAHLIANVNAPIGQINPLKRLLKMEITNEMIQGLQDAKFAWKRLIVQGHLIIIVAEANGGKTTIMTFISAELVKDGYQVIYINADASMSNLKEYAIQGQRDGYVVISPDLSNITTDEVISLLKEMSKSNEDYSKTVIVLDTLKKFADLMQKSKAKEFNNILRALTTKGLTVICLAHTNKYKDADGRPVFEGTGDLRNDCDELIYLNPVTNPDGTKTVTTDYDKVRADIENVSFKILPDRSVVVLPTTVDTVALAKEQKTLIEDAELIEFISFHVQEYSKSKPELIKLAKDAGIETNRRVVERVVEQYCQGKAIHPQWRKVRNHPNGFKFLGLTNQIQANE